MLTPEELVGLALEAAEEGLAAGELPVGAVVVAGGEVLGRAHTQERTEGRRLVHADLLAMEQADLLAMEQADRRLGWAPRAHPLTLAVTLEPCLMCLGAATALGVTTVHFGFEAPDDGASTVARGWRPARAGQPFSHLPALTGGLRRLECRDLFARYAATGPTGSRLQRYAADMAALPDHPPA